MTVRAFAALSAAAFVLSAASAARAQNSAPVRTPARILDVPFIQQSEALCGGAAAAMVMRYWGESGVYAETFAPLVDKNAGGIRGEALLAELRGRGWNAQSFKGDAPTIKARLREGQPVVALIEDRPGAFHYVVVVAWLGDQVVVHDPARNPFRVLPARTFEAAWDKSDRWTMLTLPGGGRAEAPFAAAETVAKSKPSSSICAAMVEEGVQNATRGDYDAALQTLKAASAACPSDSAPWREMAGVYAVRKDWRQAAAFARTAVNRDPSDELAWRILATSRFLADDRVSALDAWNRLGEPVVDIVNINGLERTRHSAAAAVTRVTPRTLLTSGRLAAADRRLHELPAAQTTRLTYRPLDAGQAAVDAVVLERTRTPVTRFGLVTVAARTLSERETGGWFTNPAGAGDLIEASWRWWPNRPRIAVSYSTPVAFGGIVRSTVYRDVQRYFATTDGAQVRERREGGTVRYADWTTHDLRWEVGAGIDAWSGRGRTFSVGGAVDQRLLRDHVSLHVGGDSFSGAFTSWAGQIAADWRSSVRHEGSVVLARAGLGAAASRAPLALWPGAGLGHARPILLRAHPLLDGGIVEGEVFGRRVVHGGGEWRRWFRPRLRIIPIAPAVFLDLAKASQRFAPGDAWQADGGAGLRIAVPGAGVLRVDVARGTRDGRTVFSIGFMSQ